MLEQIVFGKSLMPVGESEAWFSVCFAWQSGGCGVVGFVLYTRDPTALGYEE